MSPSLPRRETTKKNPTAHLGSPLRRRLPLRGHFRTLKEATLHHRPLPSHFGEDEATSNDLGRGECSELLEEGKKLPRTET